ncbi:MAG: TM1802 family CRISPR-associated protein [bacterium]
MLNSLYKLGLQLEAGDELDQRLINSPKLKKNKNYFIIKIVIDLDENKIIIDPQNLEEYSENHSIKKYKCFKLSGPRGKKTNTSGIFKSFNEAIIPIYGDKKKGDLLEKLDSYKALFSLTKLARILTKIYEKQEHFVVCNLFAPQSSDIPIKTALNSELVVKLANNEIIILYYLALKSIDEGYPQPEPLAEVEGYTNLIKKIFTSSGTDNGSICYASGKYETDITCADFKNRKDLNKVFVTTTINYANNFEKSNYVNNYKLSNNVKSILEQTSDTILNKLNITIAGTPHLIIPELLHTPNINTKLFLLHLKQKNDLVFNNKEIKQFIEDFKLDHNLDNSSVYWINYIGYETNGNYFKIINRIKDVNNIHFDNVVKTFANTGVEFDKTNKYVFNLHRLYSIIPIRNPKAYKNIALNIISSILERRKIDIQNLFDCFKELIIYYFFERSKITGQYQNVYPKCSREKFDFAIKTSVTNYLIVFKALLKLNQLFNYNFIEGTMEDKSTNVGNNQPKENELFNMLNYSDAQKAMFYLGRMVNSIGYAQYEKGHKQKPILQKINFNGMALRDIAKLRNELFEKARQYNKTNSITFLDSNFSALFDFNNWKLPPNEALFFLLNGYSYFINSKENNNQNETTEELNG